MKENQATGHKSTFLASLFGFFGPFWSYWVWAKKCLFIKNQITKKYFMTLKTKFGTPKYIFMLHIPQIFIFISYFDQQKHFWAKLDLQHGFYNWGLCEKCVPQVLSPFSRNYYFA